MKFILDEQHSWCFESLDYVSKVRIDRYTDIIAALLRLNDRLVEILQRVL